MGKIYGICRFIYVSPSVGSICMAFMDVKYIVFDSFIYVPMDGEYNMYSSYGYEYTVFVILYMSP